MSIIYNETNLPKACQIKKIMTDYTGKQYNRLTFLYPCRDNKDRLKWICQCDCGNYVEVFAKNVVKGNTKSCGCLAKENPANRVDLTGKKFGRLLVLGSPKVNERHKGGTLWECKCDCGTICYVESSYLVHGNTRSCGCLKKDLHSTMNDLTNQHFGDLIALYTDKVSKHGERIWHCQCVCGKETEVRAGALRSGKIHSCGCKKSKNNRIIEKFLIEKNIEFIAEYTFEDLYISSPKGRLKFDFAIFNNDKLIGLIEYQGVQHFIPVDYFGGVDNFNKQKERDNKKKEYCFKNNIPLYFINYDEDTLKKLEGILNELFCE